MNLLWPGFLLLLGCVPAIIVAYLWIQRRRRVALRYSSLSLVRAALPRHSRLRRHLPFALFLLALISLIVALGRPVRFMSVPSSEATIILTLDVSRSMRQNDILPSRMEAAKQAALQFVQRHEASTRIGIAAFAGYAELVQRPTSDKESLQIAIQSLIMARGTAMGSGILEALDAIAEIDETVAPSVAGTFRSSGQAQPGAYVPHVIVLLTDGVTTTGPEPLEAAHQAADRGVRVYTIGFGTENGSEFFGGGNSFGTPNQQGGGGFRRGLDEETLKQVAEITGGEYYEASSAGELLKVFQELPTTLITRTEVVEISVVFAAAGALLVALAMALALWWHPLP